MIAPAAPAAPAAPLPMPAAGGPPVFVYQAWADELELGMETSSMCNTVYLTTLSHVLAALDCWMAGLLQRLQNSGFWIAGCWIAECC